MIIKLNERFGEGWPDWVYDALKSRYLKDTLNKRNLDLANAKFIETTPPTSNRDPILKDPNKLILFDLEASANPTKYSNTLYWTPGLDYSYAFQDNNGDWVNPASVSWKLLLNRTKHFGYFDLTDAENRNTQIRQDRKDLRKTVYLDRDKNKQYKSPYTGTWRTQSSRGQYYDKSGYPLNPDKYIDMLNNVNLDNYGVRLKVYYDKAESARKAMIKAYAALDKIDINTDISGYKNSRWNTVYDDLSRMNQEFRDVLSSYNNIMDQVKAVEKKVANNVTGDDLDWEVKYLADIFKRYGPELNRDANNVIEYANNIISFLNTFDVPAVQSTEDVPVDEI